MISVALLASVAATVLPAFSAAAGALQVADARSGACLLAAEKMADAESQIVQGLELPNTQSGEAQAGERRLSWTMTVEDSNEDPQLRRARVLVTWRGGRGHDTFELTGEFRAPEDDS